MAMRLAGFSGESLLMQRRQKQQFMFVTGMEIEKLPAYA
jgi:hypothetical protein